MPFIVVSPGSEPVTDPTSVEHATANMAILVADLVERYGPGWGVVDSDPQEVMWHEKGTGRWTFTVSYGEGKVLFEVDMPGLPIEGVRYLDLPGQDIFAYPRLYVDGSSWIWDIALNVMNPAEADPEED